MIENSMQPDGSFPILQALTSATPLVGNATDTPRLYNGDAVEGLKMDQLAYFGISMFWRAAVHAWGDRTKPIKIELGPYLEGLRRFLIDDSPLPSRVAMSIFVGTSETSRVMMPPNRFRRGVDGITAHRFTVPGLTFDLFIGASVPRTFGQHCALSSPRIIAVYQAVDDYNWRMLLDAVRRTKQ